MKLVQKKRCKICGLNKPIGFFYARSTRDGYMSWCKSCGRIGHKEESEIKRKEAEIKRKKNRQSKFTEVKKMSEPKFKQMIYISRDLKIQVKMAAAAGETTISEIAEKALRRELAEHQREKEIGNKRDAA